MYRSVLDHELGIAILSWKSAPANEAEWQEHIDDVVSVRSWKHLANPPCVIVELLDGSFLPDARQRRDIVSATDHPDFRPQLSVVSTNPMIRGVLRALTWLKVGKEYPMVAFSTVGAAIAWHEQLRGHPIPELREMVQRLHSEWAHGGRERLGSGLEAGRANHEIDDVTPSRRFR